ncbi:ssDNA-binding protein, mitochondrial [Taxawa tesnikishii (nom. ined.)]|nr:ssDNA-binding protein, mitochondrial [Dothideales sp. JES 119]
MFALRSLPRSGTSAARAFSTSPAHSLARMQIIGRLADQPELTATSTGREMIRYSLGVSTGPRDESGNRATSWFKVASFMDAGGSRDVLLSMPKGSLMYLDADARMDTFTTDDGRNVSRLNLIQRSFEALSRPQNRNPTETSGVESDKDSAAEEPLSGIGQS